MVMRAENTSKYRCEHGHPEDCHHQPTVHRPVVPARSPVWDGYPQPSPVHTHTSAGHVAGGGHKISRPKAVVPERPTPPAGHKPSVTVATVAAPDTHASEWSMKPGAGPPETFWWVLVFLFLAVLIAMSMTHTGRSILVMVYRVMRYCLVAVCRCLWDVTVILSRFVATLARMSWDAYRAGRTKKLYASHSSWVGVSSTPQRRRRTYRSMRYQQGR